MVLEDHCTACTARLKTTVLRLVAQCVYFSLMILWRFCILHESIFLRGRVSDERFLKSASGEFGRQAFDNLRI
jgi:hypothetical protein